MDIQYIKQFKILTLEFGHGTTYRNNRPTLYSAGTYGRSSVLAGRTSRKWVEDWDDVETARAELKAAGIKFTDLTENHGSTHVPISHIAAGLPGEDL